MTLNVTFMYMFILFMVFHTKLVLERNKLHGVTFFKELMGLSLPLLFKTTVNHDVHIYVRNIQIILNIVSRLLLK